MKFDLTILRDVKPVRKPQTGDVFLADEQLPAFYWVILEKTDIDELICLGVDVQGRIVKTATFKDFVFLNKKRVGIISNLKSLNLTAIPSER